MTSKQLTIINFVIITYFMLIWLAYVYKLDFVLIGVLIELVTIPLFIAQIVFLAISIKYLINNKTNKLLTMSVISLSICAIVTIGSLF